MNISAKALHPLSIVAMSGILNTMNDTMKDFADFNRIKSLCLGENFLVPSREVKELTDDIVREQDENVEYLIDLQTVILRMWLSVVGDTTVTSWYWE
jgi:hypothetical protein